MEHYLNDQVTDNEVGGVVLPTRKIKVNKEFDGET
jgi:hypothetical protein